MSQALNVKRADVKAYLPIAISAVAREDAQNRRREGVRESNAGVWGGRAIDNGWYRQHVGTPEKDSLGRWVLRLPNVAEMPGDSGISSVAPKSNPLAALPRITSPANAIGIGDYMAGVFWWKEATTNGTFVVFSAMPVPNNCEYAATIAPDVATLSESEQMPIPSGLEEAVLSRTAAWFKQQKQTPANRILNDRDINESVQP